MRTELFASLRQLVLTIMACGVAYPMAVLAVAAVVAPSGRMGSLISRDGQLVGSLLIAQDFSKAEYFWPRPSAVAYNAAAAGGSNLSPANPQIRARAAEIIARLDLPTGVRVPVDLVAASGGGLDPHISYAAAAAQLGRIARVRHMSENEVRTLVDEIAEAIPLTADRARIVNVLQLNLALDAADVSRTQP